MRKAIFLLLLASCPLWAVNGLTSAFPFLQTDFNPRTAGASNAFTTLRGDIGSIHVNPAGMAYAEGRRYVANYTSYLLDISGGYVAYGQRLPFFDGYLTGAITYVDYGNFKATDEYAQETGSFSANDVALSVSLGSHLSEQFSYGVTLKYAFSKIENVNASAVAFDFGLLYKAPFQEDLYFGFALQNVGQMVSYYNSTKESLPLSMRLGVSKQLAHLPLEISLSLTDINIDAENEIDRLKRFSIGGEFRLSESLRLRLGYDNKLHQDLSTLQESEFGGLSGGLGIEFGDIRFDYAYSNYTLLGNTHRFGLQGSIN